MAAHTYLTQDIGVKLTSITDLEHEDLVALMAFLAQDLERQNTTVKRTLLYLKEFYEFTVQMQKIQKPNPFMGIKIPQFIPKDKTKPVTDEAIQQILAHHADMPLDVFLIHARVCITGARVSSICHLTIDALGQTADGRYYVKVINEKNAVKSIVKGRQNFIFHEIFSDLFEKINAYIAKTAHLRKQLDTPYIFVYETEGQYREGSKRLPKQGFTSALANARLTVLARLVQLCEMYELRPANMLIDCSRRFPQQNKYLKAPERDVIWRLDELFFDAENDISLPIRTMYLMLRLICNRISEVLAIEIDCLSYPEENIFCITIPTFKKTPFHVPEYYDYYRLKTGVIEGYLHDCLCQQIAFAKKCQSSIRDEAKGLLFVSSSGTSLVTNSMFNKFLSKLCNEYHIYDSTGHIAKVTSHALRHYGVTERNFFQLISQEMTRLECNHSNEWATIGYSYPASVDAAATSQKVLAMAFPQQFTEKTLKNETSEPQVFREYLYRTAEKQDTVRLIPGNGLCQCSGCIPRFAVCANCKSFIPDPQYKDILIKTSLRLKDKIERLQKNNADSEIIRFNQMQLDTLQILLSRIT